MLAQIYIEKRSYSDNVNVSPGMLMLAQIYIEKRSYSDNVSNLNVLKYN